MESRRLKMEAFTPMPSASLGAGAATATAAAGYGKVAFPRRVARETVHPGRRWLQRYFREVPLAARRRRGAWASGRAGRAGCTRRLCRHALPGGVVVLGIC